MKCTLCKDDKSIEEFSWKNKKKNIKHTRCKICVSRSVKKHYLQNKEKYKRKAKINNELYIKRNKDFIQNYLETHPCVDCGNNNPIVLDFDHVRDKKHGNISRMKLDSISLDMIKKEIDKCEIRCANCHRIKTHERRYTPVAK